MFFPEKENRENVELRNKKKDIHIALDPQFRYIRDKYHLGYTHSLILGLVIQKYLKENKETSREIRELIIKAFENEIKELF